MALINKTGITNGGTIQAEHVTRAIDALSGGSTDTVVATGSFSGSFKGDGSQLTGITGEWDGTLNGNAIITGSLINGYVSTAPGSYSHAEGEETVAHGDGSHSEGNLTVASGSSSHAEGSNTTSRGLASHAEGGATATHGQYSHAEGFGTVSSGSYSHSEGVNTVARGTSAHAEGNATVAYANYSHAEGANTVTSGSYSHAEGYGSIALGDTSHAEGGSVTIGIVGGFAEGPGSHAEGFQTYALGNASHAEGFQTSASANFSHAEGYGSKTFGAHSHAEGVNTRVADVGTGGHAEGYATVVLGEYSHAEGSGTIASGSSQHVQGTYNTHGNDTSLMIIGNGTNNSTRSDLALFNTDGIKFNAPLTASIVSGSLIGSLTGTASFATSASRAVSAATATSATSASYLNTLTQNTVTINSTASFNRNVLIGGTTYIPQQTITTTNATQTNIWSLTMGNGEAVAIEALVVGVSGSNPGGFMTIDSVGGNMAALCHYTTDAGSSTVGLTSSSFNSFAGGDPVFGVTTDGIGGNKLYVWVKGLTNTTIDWQVTIKYSDITSNLAGS